jgi:CRISPR-associated protein (TIGR03984 family)
MADIKQAMTQAGFDWLLVHTEAGVFWGRRDPQVGLVTPDLAGLAKALALPFPAEARVFGKNKELFLWRDSDGWNSRTISDGLTGQEGTEVDYFDEHHLLWGTYGVVDAAAATTTVVEGSQGFRHTLPFAATAEPNMSEGEITANALPRLRVRHYIADGLVARVALTRLVGFDADDLSNFKLDKAKQ